VRAAQAEERTATFVITDGTTLNSNEISTNGTGILILVVADAWSCCGSQAHQQPTRRTHFGLWC